jgi:hypothetical protein
VFVAEIGDVSRFSHPKQLSSWAGLTPKLRESDTTSYRESITKQGSRLGCWSAVEAVSGYHGGPPIRASYQRIAQRRGINIGRVAAARKLSPSSTTGSDDGDPVPAADRVRFGHGQTASSKYRHDPHPAGRLM